MKRIFGISFPLLKQVLLLLIGAFTTNLATADAPETNQNIIGAGASFPAPVYSKWATNYRLAYNTLVNYQSIGSGAGVKQITNRLIDFGASDYPLSEAQLKKEHMIQFPTLGGGIVLAVNLKELSGEIILDGPTIADIYLGNILRWDDERIKALNPTIADKLPAIYIAVLFRSDGSGTTYNFTKYLSNQSPTFKEKLGYGKTVNFPVGLGGKGNEGVAAVLPRVYGAIGYIEFGYAESLGLGVAKISSTYVDEQGNQQSFVVTPSLESFTKAISVAFANNPEHPEVAKVNYPGAWPINALTYVLFHDDQNNLAQLKHFFNFGLFNQSEETSKLLYVPLAKDIAENVMAKAFVAVK